MNTADQYRTAKGCGSATGLGNSTFQESIEPGICRDSLQIPCDPPWAFI